MRTRLISGYLLITLVEGIFAVVFLASSASMEKNAVWFGFSYTRLILLFFCLIAVAIIGGLWWKFGRSYSGAEQWVSFHQQRLIQTDLFILVSEIVVGLVIIVGGYHIVQLPAVQNLILRQSNGDTEFINQVLSLSNTFFKRTWMISGWGWLFLFQTLLIWLWLFRSEYVKRLHDGTVARVTLILLIGVLYLIHALILIFQMKVLLHIPGWKWYFQPKPFSIYTLLFIPLLFIVLYVVYQTGRQQVSWLTGWKSVVALAFLAIVIQYAFGLIGGQGFDAIRLKYADSVFAKYASEAAMEPGFLASLKNYENWFGKVAYLDTKPPGVLLFYIAVQRLANFFTPEVSVADKFTNLTWWLTAIMPLLAAGGVILLWKFSQSLVGNSMALLPGLVFITCPNFVLIPLYLDQAVYPGIFLLLLLGAKIGLNRPRFWTGFWLGAGYYLALFMSFSLLPAGILIVTWWGGYWFFNRMPGSFKAFLKMGLGLVLGFLTLFLIFWAGTGYDLYQRYQYAMEIHRMGRDVLPGIKAQLEIIYLNNAEMITWSGIGVFTLALFSGFQSLKNLVHRKVQSTDLLFIALGCTYLFLNIFGQTRAEVQRLWLFLIPLVSIFASLGTSSLFRRREWGFLILCIYQLTLTLLIFQFQDFYG